MPGRANTTLPVWELPEQGVGSRSCCPHSQDPFIYTTGSFTVSSPVPQPHRSGLGFPAAESKEAQSWPHKTHTFTLSG